MDPFNPSWPSDPPLWVASTWAGVGTPTVLPLGPSTICGSPHPLVSRAACQVDKLVPGQSGRAVGGGEPHPPALRSSP